MYVVLYKDALKLLWIGRLELMIELNKHLNKSLKLSVTESYLSFIIVKLDSRL